MDQTSITTLLASLKGGDPEAVDLLFEQVYGTLREMARKERLTWRNDQTLNTTALVHEAYIKLVDQDISSLESKAHFLNVAGKVMRHLLIDHSRSKLAQKRGGDVNKESIDMEADIPWNGIRIDETQALELVALDAAMNRLSELNQREAQVVQCRFFAGMTIPETALALDVSEMTVKRDWNMAKAWLFRELKAH